jgi:rubrerythrin
MELEGSKTEKNLLKAFAGESQARNRYTYFSSVAKKEGFKQIEAIFIETADNEKEHAKVFFKHLNEIKGKPVEITASYPAGCISTTGDNLLASAQGEHEEWSELYPEFARVAREEGFIEVAISFEQIAKVEKEHERRYNKLLDNIKEGKVFEKEGVVRWKCRNCGYVVGSSSAPHVCPACSHPQAHFELFCEAY